MAKNRSSLPLRALCSVALATGLLPASAAQAAASPSPFALQPSIEVTAAQNTDWKFARDQAINEFIDGSQYQCDPTDFNAWIGDELSRIENFDAFIAIADLGVLDWPIYYSMLVDQNGNDEYIGLDGQYTRILNRRHKDAKRFWNMPKRKNILLQGIHGDVVADDEKMVPLVQMLYGVDAGTAQWLVDDVQNILESDAGMGYDFSLLSLNAFAVTFRYEPEGSPFAGLPDKIIMGDGIMKALEDIGLDSSAVDGVHAHEFGHHVQYDLGLLESREETPENTRRMELMADAFGAYFSAHPRGSGFRADRIAEIFEPSYLIGDCQFDSPGHHGTPNQRFASATWGANQARKGFLNGWILPSPLMLALFDKYLPIILAPDAQ